MGGDFLLIRGWNWARIKISIAENFWLWRDWLIGGDLLILGLHYTYYMCAINYCIYNLI